MTAVRGTFADFKTVKTRGVCQLIIEVPIESADHALAVLGGVPQAKAEQWVGIAPVTAPEQSQTAEEAERLLLATETPEEPERLKGGARANRAGILCGDAAFQNWLFQRELKNDWPVWAKPATDEGHAAGCLRWLCGIESRAELDHNEEAGRTFDRIVADFEYAQRGGDEELARQAAEGPG